MGAITGTKAVDTEFAGAVKLITVTATMAAASDTITLTAANHGGVVSIVGLGAPRIITNMGANCMGVQASYSGLVITLTGKNAAGAAATAFPQVEIPVYIKTQ